MSNMVARRRFLLSGVSPAFLAGLGTFCCIAGAQAQSTSYQTLNYGTSGTFLTGIRGNTIVGNYVVPGSGATGGLLYDMTSGTWSAFPVATANGVNYPDATGSSPYGPSFGSQYGVLRAVGSYLTAGSPYDLSYLYDAAAAPGQQLTTLVYPSASGNPTLFTIAHSTFGDTVVGNYDTRLATGNAMIYTISTGTYTTNNKPGAVSTTAYGVYGDMIAGGYANAGVGGGIGFEHGYLYNTVTGTWTTYDHPDAIITHLEGITGAGRSGEYNMVADWVTADGVVHAGVLHVDALGIATWYEIIIPGATLVSSNSAYGSTVVGIYLTSGSTVPNGYVATIPGIYNPISNTGTLTSSADNAAALSGAKGDDIVNSGTVRVTGTGGIGMRGETYGVLTNTGTVVATGLAGAAVELHGLYGTLLNYGALQAPAVADALRTGPDSYGTVIVNYGVIDGRLAATAGPAKRFENSGWLGVSGTGVTIASLLSGTFVQTAAGTLSLRVTASGNDTLGIFGTARLGGTMAVPFQTTPLTRSYTLLTATEGITGTFASLVTSGLPSFMSATLAYDPQAVSLNLTSAIGQMAGLNANQGAVGAALDRAYNALPAMSGPLAALYALDGSQMPAALSALSGEAYASEQSVLMGDALYGRQSVLGRLRQGTYGSQSGTLAALSFGGPALAFAGADAPAPVDAAGALAYAVKAPGVPVPSLGPTVWAQGFGVWNDISGTSTSAAVSETLGGMMAGMDGMLGDWRLGFALGYAQSNATAGTLASSVQSDNVTAALYAGTSFGALNLRLGASYTFNQVDGTRAIAVPGLVQTVNGQYDGGTSQLFAEVGYGLALNTVALEPFVGLAYVHLDTNAFTETSAGTLASAGLTAAATNADVGYTSLGLRAATVVPLANGMALAPHASAAWLYAFGDVSPATQMAFTSLPSASFSVAGVPLAQNSALLEVGTDLRLTAQSRVGLSYVGQYGDGVTANAFEATFAFTF